MLDFFAEFLDKRLAGGLVAGHAGTNFVHQGCCVITLIPTKHIMIRQNDAGANGMPTDFFRQMYHLNEENAKP